MSAAERFQSSLAPKGESNRLRFSFSDWLRLFQSSLAPKGESNPAPNCSCTSFSVFQSSLAPKGESNMTEYGKINSPDGFNPLSPRRARATGEGGGEGKMTRVSILSRPEGREQPHIGYC